MTNHTISLSDPVYDWLNDEAQKRGLDTIEELLEAWKVENRDRDERDDLVGRITALRQQLYEKYGEMPDSTALIREDRQR